MTTPATTDLDTLKALEQAATPGPWRAHDTWLTYGGFTATVLAGEGQDVLRAWLPTFSNDPAVLGPRNVHNDATLIAAMRNALPELLALASTCTCAKTSLTYEGPEADCPVHGAVRALAEVTRERDAAREELAKTRAELGATHTELERLRGVIREGVDMAEWHRNEVTNWKRKAAKLREQLGSAKARISTAATVEVWTNEDGKRFVFADDLMAALDPNPEANPATTAEPAEEDAEDAPCKTCGRPWRNRRHECQAESADEPKATFLPAINSAGVGEGNCNCQAIKGTPNYPGPWHPRGDTPTCPDATPAQVQP